MDRYIRKGDTIQIHNYSETIIAYGDVVKISTRVGIAASNINPGEVGTLNIVGVYEMKAESDDVLAIGDTVYLNEDGNITKTVGDTVAGMAVEVKLSGASVAMVKIG